MKKRFFKALCPALCVLLAVSLSSCGMFRSIRENAQKASQREILATPDAEQLVSVYNDALGRSLADAEAVDESVSFSVGKPDVEGESAGAGMLDAAADTLKKMVMQFSPGSSSTLEKGAVNGTLLSALNAADVLASSGARDEVNEAVTDEDGKEVTDEDGNVLTAPVIVDNILYTELCYYTEDVKTEPSEDGGETETKILLPAPDAVIESVFGAKREQSTVLAGFDALKDYLQVKDYTLKYKDCVVRAQTDLESGRLLQVEFVKNMDVTAAAAGVGALAETGDITVSFGVTETTSYTFTYAEAAD